jgi:hypothetical protein
MIPLLVSCIANPNTAAEQDNWLAGSFADENGLEIGSVVAAAGQLDDDWKGLTLDYYDRDGVALVELQAVFQNVEGCAAVSDDSHPPQVSSEIGDIINDDVQMSFEFEDDMVRGSFVVNVEAYLRGDFYAPVEWR